MIRWIPLQDREESNTSVKQALRLVLGERHEPEQWPCSVSFGKEIQVAFQGNTVVHVHNWELGKSLRLNSQGPYQNGLKDLPYPHFFFFQIQKTTVFQVSKDPIKRDMVSMTPI